MEGTNKITLNAIELANALQHYLNTKVFQEDCQVISVKVVNEYGNDKYAIEFMKLEVTINNVGTES